MSENETEMKNQTKYLKLLKIIDFNKKKLEKKQGLRLKILTPNQMLSRLQISLAHLKAGNNSDNQTIIVFFAQTKKTYKATL